MKKYLAAALVLLLLSCDSHKIDKECQPILNKFFDGISKGNYGETLDDFLRSNKYMNPKDSAVVDMRSKFDKINTFSGKYIGVSLLKKRNLNDDVMIYSYLVKYEKRFYRFVFIFYKIGDVPSVYKFMFDDTWDVELEESLNLYIP